MKKEKEYTIIISNSGRAGDKPDREVTGTLDYLKQYFSYTIEIGCSWNSKINRYPKTIKSLMKTLEMSYDEKEGACYNRTSLELK
jgi:hypothetical protein